MTFKQPGEVKDEDVDEFERWMGTTLDEKMKETLKMAVCEEFELWIVPWQWGEIWMISFNSISEEEFLKDYENRKGRNEMGIVSTIMVAVEKLDIKRRVSFNDYIYSVKQKCGYDAELRETIADLFATKSGCDALTQPQLITVERSPVNRNGDGTTSGSESDQ